MQRRNLFRCGLFALLGRLFQNRTPWLGNELQLIYLPYGAPEMGIARGFIECPSWHGNRFAGWVLAEEVRVRTMWPLPDGARCFAVWSREADCFVLLEAWHRDDYVARRSAGGRL